MCGSCATTGIRRWVNLVVVPSMNSAPVRPGLFLRQFPDVVSFWQRHAQAGRIRAIGLAPDRPGDFFAGFPDVVDINATRRRVEPAPVLTTNRVDPISPSSFHERPSHYTG